MTYTVAIERDRALVVASASAWPALGRATWATGAGTIAVVQGRAERSRAIRIADRGSLDQSDLAEDQQAILLQSGRVLVESGPSCWPQVTTSVVEHVAAASNCSSSPSVAQVMTEVAAAHPGDAVGAALAALSAGSVSGGDARGTNAAYLTYLDDDGERHWRIDWSQSPVSDLQDAITSERTLHDLYDGRLEPDQIRPLAAHATRVVRFWAGYDLTRRGLDAPDTGWSDWEARRLGELEGRD